MRRYTNEITVFCAYIFASAVAIGFMISAEKGWLWQFSVIYYVFGLAAMVGFGFFMQSTHQSRGTLMTSLFLCPFAALFWWVFWPVGIEDWLKAKTPPKINGNLV